MAPQYLHLGSFGYLLLFSVLWVVARSLRRRGSSTTRLNGPPSQSFIWGLARYISQSLDASVVYEDWGKQYGHVFQIPVELGQKQIILLDPKALTHFYTSERTTYVKTENERFFIAKMFGRGVLWAEGETHKRQRKALTPAFKNAAIRRLTAVFYDSAYKLKSFWDATLESTSDGAIIEVEHWMNRIALDSIGLAGFSHDFRYLDGHKSPVAMAFDALQEQGTNILFNLIFIMSRSFPFVLNLPTKQLLLFRNLNHSLSNIAQRLLENARREKQGAVAEEFTDKSVIGLLLRAEGADTQLHMMQEEVVAQSYFANLSGCSGYETTPISLTWALIELAKHPEMQDKLRSDIARFSGVDPTWDQLISGLPYLDAAVLEILRLHPPIIEIPRVAQQDDVMPLSTPIVTPSGETITNIFIGKGTVIVAPIRCINRSEALWGRDSKEFKPERWHSDITVRAKELQGYRHLLTFHDGPRTCLGRAFALAELKASSAALLVLIRHFSFEFPDGPDTKIEEHVALLPRPGVAGQNGAKVPMRVRRIE
ncbi:cytochrome P450 [Mycena rebaudengoi]|nr:cytochrome P450 [Mycena rebaudengoi]